MTRRIATRRTPGKYDPRPCPTCYAPMSRDAKTGAYRCAKHGEPRRP